MSLKNRIEEFYQQPPTQVNRAEALQAFNELKFFLNVGDQRAARPISTAGSARLNDARSNDARLNDIVGRGVEISASLRAKPQAEASDLGELGRAVERSIEPQASGWVVNDWVKKGILLGFRLGELTDVSINREFHFFDKNTYPLKKLTLENQVRLVPGGSSIRDGVFIAKNVVVMPPAYINVGAYVDEGSMIDSHALVGSCAQIGKRVHISASAQIGGVLEPVGALPVIIEDDVFIGGNCGIYEGTVVKKRAVVAAGVILTGGTPVYDVVNKCVLRKTVQDPLVIPEGAVVVAGSRPLDRDFAREHHLSVYTPIIVKYRDANTDAATVLEESLR